MIALIDSLGGLAGLIIVCLLAYLAILTFLMPWFVYKIYQYSKAQLEAHNRVITILWEQTHPHQ